MQTKPLFVCAVLLQIFVLGSLGSAKSFALTEALAPAESLSSALPISRAEPRVTEPQIDLIFASDLRGDFAAQNCNQDTPSQNAGLVHLARTITKAKENSPQSVVIGGGGLLGPRGSARFLTASQSGSEKAALLLNQAGIEVISLGVSELAIAKETLLSYLNTWGRLGASPVLSNVECKPNNTSLCQATQRSVILVRGDLKIGLLSTIPEDTSERVGPGHLHDAKVLPSTHVGKEAKALRTQVDLLVLNVDTSSKWNLWDVIKLVRSFEAQGTHLDVVHLTKLDEDHGGVTSVVLDQGTILVGSPSQGQGVTKVSLVPTAGNSFPGKEKSSSASQYKALAEFVTEPGLENEALAKSIGQIQQEMCKTFNASVAALPSAGLDRAKFTQMVLDAMREHAKAEVALINTGAISEQGLPFTVASMEALGNVLPFKARVVRASVLGQDLIDALKKYLASVPQQKLRSAGLSLKGEDLLVNGRAVSPGARYRVVTIDFLLAGGNGLLPDKLLQDPKVIADDLQKLVLAYLEKRKTPDQIIRPLTLEDRPLWTVAFDLGADLQNVTVNNPNNLYDRPQLSRDPSIAFKLDGSLRIEMDHPKHLFQWMARGQYGQSWLYARDLATDPNSARNWVGQETADLINTQALYSFRGLSLLHPRLPTPYASLGLESEFTRPDNRTYTHLELSAAAGFRMSLPGQISANAGVGIRSELLADRNSPLDLERNLAKARFLFTTTLEMQKRPLWPKWGNALLGEFLLSYHFTDPSALKTHEFRIAGKLYIALKRPLYFTIGSDFYLFRMRDNDPGYSWDLLVGLKVLFDTRTQMF